MVRDGLGYIFSFLTSLASGGVTSKLGSIVVLPGCGDGIVVSRLMGAPLGGSFMTDVRPSLVTVLKKEIPYKEGS
jgi:hypothetical protein